MKEQEDLKDLDAVTRTLFIVANLKHWSHFTFKLNYFKGQLIHFVYNFEFIVHKNE